jgi:endonuclease IV
MQILDRQLMYCNGLDLQYWPLVKHEVERAFRSNHDRMDINDIELALQEKRMQLWAIHDGEIKCVFVTQIINHAKCKAIRVITVTGIDHQEWLKLGVDTLVQWGQEIGCTMLEMQGRRGWEKPLKAQGFDEPQILMTKHF